MICAEIEDLLLNGTTAFGRDLIIKLIDNNYRTGSGKENSPLGNIDREN